MTTRRIYIVEDNLSFAIQLEMNLQELGYHILHKASNAEEALKDILSQSPDLIIMDINLAGEMSGLELAMALKPSNIPILFITVHDRPEYFEAAKNANLAGYLVKPFDMISLQGALEVAFRNQEQKADPNSSEEHIIRQEGILIKHQGEYLKVSFQEIDYINSEGSYCTLFSRGKKHVLKISMRQLLKGLPSGIFVRIHKSYVVNLTKVDSINARTREVVMGSNRFPLGKEFKDELLDRFSVIK